MINAESVYIEHQAISDAIEIILFIPMAILMILPFGFVVTSVIAHEELDRNKDIRRAKQWLKENLND